VANEEIKENFLNTSLSILSDNIASIPQLDKLSLILLNKKGLIKSFSIVPKTILNNFPSWC
jgi:hypothetical protein